MLVTTTLSAKGTEMAETQIRFEDGLSYERYMGDWSRRVGTFFIDWLALPSGLKWIDVGCGTALLLN
jgi:ubiquinone/menaquinone biosynthesis C-methylase UbiE